MRGLIRRRFQDASGNTRSPLMSVYSREDGLQICKRHQRKLVIPINLPSDCFGDLENCFINRKKTDGVVSLQENST